jgi:hypothetical protein
MTPDICLLFGGIPVQIIGACSTPKITSISPKTWFAGTSYPVTITGTGFTTSANATASCPVTPVAAKVASGSSASLTNVTVVSPTQITFTVEPGASDPTGNAAITVGSSSNGGAVSVRTQILGNQIQWNGQTISTTDGSTPPAQEAVVGQQIALTTTTPATTAYDGSPISQLWTVGGTRIANYAPTTASASVTELTDADMQKSNVTFYWVYPGSPIPVTYQYCVIIKGANPILQCSLPTDANFNISGGGTIAINPYNGLTIDQLIPCVNGTTPATGTQAPFVVYGNITGWNCSALYPGSAFGMTFTPSGAPSGGTYSYVQLINSDNPTSTQGNASSGCTFSQGLDGNYPYAGIIPGTNPPQAEDAPGDGLINGWVETRTFNATMFLMWTSNLPNSITVPIGYQNWGFSGGAQQDITGAWLATTNGTPGPIGGFVTSSGDQKTDGYTTLQYGYPIWSDVAMCN